MQSERDHSGYYHAPLFCRLDYVYAAIDTIVISATMTALFEVYGGDSRVLEN